MIPIKKLLMCCLTILYLSGCAASVQIPVSGTDGQPPEKTEAQIAKERIVQKLKEAVEGGKSEVNIYLDENPDLIQTGDLVTINVTSRTEDGRLMYTTVAEINSNEGQTWIPGHAKSERVHPVEVIAGESGGFPGVNNAVIGMHMNEKKITTILAEDAFGESDPKKIKEYPSIRKVPKFVEVRPRDFVKQYGIFPVVGNQIDFNPYLDARIREVSEQKAVLEINAKPETEIEQASYGTTQVVSENDTFIIRLTPEIGKEFEAGNEQGWITKVGEDRFTVDFNHPAAGKTIVLEVEVLDFTKASVAHNNEIAWIEDYNQGEEQSREQNKPMVLLLYADWCQWSQKLIQDVLKDPRITKLHDRFVWVKIDSDKHREYKEGFDQKNYPKMLILDVQGEILDTMDGYHNVHVVSEHLNDVHAGNLAG